jgi:hypothetical protein
VSALIERFVGPHIHRADGHRQTVHAIHGSAVSLLLLFFVWQMALAAHEQKLAAKQAHAHSTRCDGGMCVFGHFNVGQQLDLLPIQGDRWCVPQTGQPLALEIALALFETVIGQDDGRRIHDDHARIAVNDDPIVLLNQLAGGACAHHCRNVQTAGHDGSV